MFLLGNSARYKILRAAQLHHNTPKVSEETDSFIPLFNFLSEYVEEHWMVQEQWTSCKWAAGRDESLAAAMMLYYGWAQRYPEYKINHCCIFQLRRSDDGIHIIISEPHTFNDRLTAACARALAVAESFRASRGHAPYVLLFQEAARVFFSFNNYYLTMTSDFRQVIMNKLQAFCQRLTNAIDTSPPTIPYVDQPENLFKVEYNRYGEPREYILKWEDFIFEEGSTRQKLHLQEVRNNINLTTLLDGWKKAGLDLNGEYSGPFLAEHFTKTTLAKARKDDTRYLIPSGRKEGRTKFWKLNPEILDCERS